MIPTATRAAAALAFCAALAGGAHAQPIATVAGGGVGDGDAATNAGLFYPRAVALDAGGNLYIADQSNHRIRKVAAGTGIITTIAGHGGVATFAGDGGPAVKAALNTPRGVAVDAAGNVYIADYANHRVRKVAAGSGIITTVAGTGSASFCGDGGPATEACLQYPAGVTVDADGNLFIADEYNIRIRKVMAATGIITTVAGSSSFSGLGDGGPATSAYLSYPNGVALDASGNMFIADAGNHRIRKVTAGTGVITTVAGNGESGPPADGGLAVNARLQWPYGIALDAAGNLFIADYGNQRIRKVAADTQVISTVAGSGGIGFDGDGGPATSASLDNPTHVAVDAGGNLFFADFANHRVRRVDAGSGVIDTIAGDGTTVFRGDGGAASGARLNFPSAVAFDAAGNLYIAERDNNRVRRVAADTGVITSLADAGLNFPLGVAADASGNVFISDSHNHRIRKVTSAGAISTIVGSGELSTPAGIALDAGGNLYIADYDNHRVRKLDAATGTISTVAGSGVPGFMGDDGPATSARLTNPFAVAIDAAGNLFIADSTNFRIRKVAADTGTITTVAGNGSLAFAGDGGPATAASLWPQGLASDAGGNLYVADYSSMRVRRISAATGTIATVAGDGNRNLSGDGGPATAASLASPLAVALDGKGNLFIADSENNRVRRVAIGSRALRDHDGDGNADVLWRNGSTGENYLYFMNGTAIVAEGYVRTVADQSWRVAGIGDFDGDGRADILWRNSSTGENYIYLMNGTNIVGEGYTRTVADQNWQIAGVSDFDGDGRDDILWRNAATGENYVYLMNGTTIAGEGYLRTVADQGWQIVGVGDFDGDGKSDILWRHATSGENYLYPMDGTAIKPSEGYIRTVADTQWQIKGVGDFNGDGKADIAWRNSATGENYIYLMDGSNIVGEGYVRTVPDANWRIVAVGEYDGDGKSDILWRNTSTGENYLYPMDGTTIKPSEGYLRTVADQNWRVQNPPSAD